MEFYKLQANGNNFIITISNDVLNQDIEKMCDYKYGIGADGYINIDSKFNVSIFNKDGSSAKMCGNGLRCLVKLLSKLTNQTSFTFYINGKEVYGYIENELCSISIDSPILLKQNEGYYLSLMNNHFVSFDDDIDQYCFTEKDIEFCNKNKCNMHIVKVINKTKIKIKTYEYGVGKTTSCGSGSICAFYVANMLNKVNDQIEIISEGGSLFAEILNNKYILKGMVKLIYKGDYYGL